MTDKPIIVNGIDVSGCEYCLKMTKYRCTIQRDVYKCLCEENPNCYYKQLKRKEQECEVIVADAEVTYTHLEHRIEMCDLLGKSLKVKEQECERLEEANNTLTVTREKLLGDLYIVEENLKDYIEHYNRQSEELDQLKVERDKIKAIGNNYFDEYEMCCLDLPDAIDSLLKRYDSIFAIFKKERKEFKEECDKFKQTLTEVKEIVLGVRNYLDCPSPRDVRYEMDIILQKISEVENE